ncbi:hypothetical protein ACLF6K_03115 [Streptomyces xanthophaeus]|uniref:hypothetical protein n=1 Tax=Streptomyces xanthophaeus TaxID=67385 RepID=UPI003990277D
MTISDRPLRSVATTGTPDHQVVLHGTDWASLDTAFGTGEGLPAALAGLLDPDPAVQADALGALGSVRHQNSFYEGTVPVALFVAAVLSHPATDTTGPGRTGDGTRTRPTRALLLEWLADLARDGDDESARIDGNEEMSAFRDLRPVFYGAVAPFLGHGEAAVGDAALIAALSLTEHPELAGHRHELVRHTRRLLATSTDRLHRNAALAALRAWGQDTSGLETAADITARNRYAAWRAAASNGESRYCDEPPF